MKILTLISGGDVGGAKTHVLSLMKELNSVASALLVCFRDGDFADEARTLGIPVEIVRSGNTRRDLELLRSMARSGGFDIIHCHGSRANFMGALLKKSLSLPVITTVHSDPKLDYMGRPAARMVYGTLNQYSLKRLDYYIGVSDAMTELLIRRGFPPDRVFTIYNGIDFTPSGREFDRAAFRESLGLAPGEVVAGVAARLNPVKDIATLIRGFALASASSPRLRLAIAGDGEQRKMLEELALSLGVAEKVKFLGWVEDMEAFYRSIDINTLTSLSETFPYALTEGAKEYLATVSSSVGGVPYLIDHGVNGLLFPAGNAEALSKCLVLLAEDDALRLSVGQKLGEKAREKYSLAATLRTQLGIYEAALRRFERRALRKRDGVTICGAYGRGNAGDDAILEAILREMRSIDPDMPLCVLSRRPKETRLRYRVPAAFTFNVPAFRRSAKRSRLYLNGGGSLIQDATSRRSLWFYLYTIAAAKRLGCRVLMYGCGIGPVTKGQNRRLAGRVLNENVDVITLREPDSLEELRNMGVEKPEKILSADPSLILSAASEAAVDSAMLLDGVPVRGKYICFTLRSWPGFDEKIPVFAAAADHAYKKHGLTPVFVPIDADRDTQAALRVAASLSCPHHVMSHPKTSGETIGIMARMTAVVSMRLHGLIFAAAGGAELVGVVYDPKVSAFLRYIGQELFCDFASMTEEQLLALIDAAVRRSTSRAGSLERLLSMEKANTDAVKKLLETE